jgi:acyl-homoserine lactone synthase
MLLMISKSNSARHGDMLERAYKLRHRIFVENMGWEALRKPDGREIDQFDTEDAVHLIGLEGGEPVSYTRLLPTLKPHLLSEVYPEILDGAEVPRAPDLYEWTRCGIEPSRRESGGSAMSPAARVLFTGVVEACLALRIRALTVETHPIWITRLEELGWATRPLGLPRPYDGQPLVAMMAEVDHRTLAKSREVLGIAEPVLCRDLPDQRPARPETPVLGLRT